ncbi:MAG: class I SAM-dependent methyltransferase [Granulosicoccus sp.]
MSDKTSASPTASKWNARYAYSGEPLPAPAEVLSRGERYLPRSQSSVSVAPLLALDLACGRAASGEWLAARGFNVTAWDISEKVIASIKERPGSRIAIAEARDVVTAPPLTQSFDVIVVCRFLERSICPAIAAALKPGGVLFYQTFTHGLSNPDYLLGSNELPELFSMLNVYSYEEPEPDSADRAEAKLVGRVG